MADGEEEVTEGGGKRNANALLLVVMLVNTLALVGGGVYFAFFHQSAGAAAPAAEEEKEPNEVGPLLPLDPIVANLADPTATRFVKVAVQLELVDEEKRPVVEAAIVPIRNAILLHLSGLKTEDTSGTENKEKIRDALLAEVHETLGTEDVRRLYFGEFVVQ